MRLSDSQINDFIQLYKKHYGVLLGVDEAREKAIELCRFVRMVSQPSPSESVSSGINVEYKNGTLQS